jgi:hypothetical protein
MVEVLEVPGDRSASFLRHTLDHTACVACARTGLLHHRSVRHQVFWNKHDVPRTVLGGVARWLQATDFVLQLGVPQVVLIVVCLFVPHVSYYWVGCVGIGFYCCRSTHLQSIALFALEQSFVAAVPIARLSTRRSELEDTVVLRQTVRGPFVANYLSY